ncbi:MAG: glucose-1-phosphate thymidylyltransferase [Eubacteriales bacterium]|nr:glucose-1-phosphate thymidylyltransferase [Eubacteriales bacterium]
MLKASDLFDLDGNPFADLFEGTEYVWDALKKLKKYVNSVIVPNISAVRNGNVMIPRTVILYDGKALDSGFSIDTSGKKPLVILDGKVLKGASIIYAGSFFMDDMIYIGKDTVIEPGALIKGPSVICNSTEVRQGAYLRGECLVGNDCVVGHTTELKSAVMLGGSKAGHFAYIGDSILGKVNLGAGTKLANLKVFEIEVAVHVSGTAYPTGLKKFGAIMGDGVETGCNSVTTPGTILGKYVRLYPGATARGYCPPSKIIKTTARPVIEDLR